MSRAKTYWRKREEEALKHYITEEAEYDKRIRRIYLDMLDGVQTEIDAFYGKYAKGENITIAEARKRVSKVDIAAYERKAKKYVKDAAQDRRLNGGKTDHSGYYFSSKANDEMRLYNLTMKVNRLEMLKANIGLEMVKGHAELEQFMGEILEGRALAEADRMAGILGQTIVNNAQGAHAIVNASFHNAHFSDRIWLYNDVMKADMSKLLEEGLIRGKNPRVLARELRKYYIGDERLKNGKKGAVYVTERLMRTELARVQTEAQRQSFKRNGFSQFMFIANGDCCDMCRPLDGKTFDIEKLMPGENAPPMHPHCRCSIAAYEDDAEYEAWLDYLDKGGTTAEWNESGLKSWKKAQKALENSKNKSTMKASNAFRCYGDYLRDRLGSAKENNAEELQDIINDVQKRGGRFELLQGRKKMVTDVSRGQPGVIKVDENASIAAIRHEYRHFLDDLEAGCPGFAYYLRDKDRFWEYEKNGYLEELAIAEAHGYTEEIKKIQKEMEKRKGEIYAE